jgi:hypothetical protein
VGYCEVKEVRNAAQLGLNVKTVRRYVAAARAIGIDPGGGTAGTG